MTLKIAISIIFFSFNSSLCILYNNYDNLKNNAKNIALDIIGINRSIINLSTLSTLYFALPTYLASLDIDKKINFIFYDKANHKHIRQFINLDYKYKNMNIEFCNILLAGSITTSAIYYLSHNPKNNIFSRNLMLGLCCLGFYKKLIKLVKWKRSLRPKNQNFTRNKKYYGGFPSGHLMTMSYLTTVWTYQTNIYKSSPFIIATSYMFIEYIMKNRHYLSQLIAGSTLGIIYGVAVHSYINKKLNRPINIINPDLIKLNIANKNLNLELAYSF